MYSWNVTKCAKALGISRRTLQLRMRQFGIQEGMNIESNAHFITAKETSMAIDSDSALEPTSLDVSSRSENVVQ
ncbi:MAG: hypothetical protein KDB65_12180 [Calditrichaeota bacterium]|nr:hypothetical protein [Calditrichota bacterium]MCB9367570.1 hypothetical protein [Calditrichota bacterium]